MPSKSRRGRGRHLSRSKRKGRKTFSAPAAQPSAVGKAYEPAPRDDKLAPPTKAPTLRAPIVAAQNPNVAAELRRIGIVAGIMIVILVVLALVLP
jgi:hypothetical protein